MLHGWIILDKPAGLGSTTAVSAVKRILREAGEPKTKVGHGGTLDPLASGVLPIALGEATKLAGRMLDATKAYDFTIRFGEETDTLDAEGQVVASSDARPTLQQVEALLPRFTGAIEQIPPVGPHHPSASLSGSPPRSGEDQVTLSATVSKGTYIRSLARDIAHALGTVGHVSYLRRTRAGPFALEQAISLDFLTEAAKARALTRTVLPLTAALDDIPALPVTPDQARLLRHGQILFGFPAKPGLQLATSDATPVALVEATADGVKVVRGFNL